MKDDSKKISFRRMALYSVSGVSATGVEWLFFYLLNGVLGLHYEASTFIAMSISGLVGWAVGRALLFKSTGHPIREIAMIYATGFIGILFNMLLMWIFVDIFSVKEMVSKAISSIIVFLWNYLTRELFIYR